MSQDFSFDLTYITKPLSNKSKEKVIDVEKEEERSLENPEQGLVLSINRRREER